MSKLKINSAKLLGYKLASAEEMALSRIGAKSGVKIGLKAGVKAGIKSGVKAGLKLRA